MISLIAERPRSPTATGNGLSLRIQRPINPTLSKPQRGVAVRCICLFGDPISISPKGSTLLSPELARRDELPVLSYYLSKLTCAWPLRKPTAPSPRLATSVTTNLDLVMLSNNPHASPRLALTLSAHA